LERNKVIAEQIRNVMPIMSINKGMKPTVLENQEILELTYNKRPTPYLTALMYHPMSGTNIDTVKSFMSELVGIFAPADSNYKDAYKAFKNGLELKGNRRLGILQRALKHYYAKYQYDAMLAEQMNIKDAKTQQNILGAQANVDTKFLNNPAKLAYNIYPRIYALAECFWTKKSNKTSFKDFSKRLENIGYPGQITGKINMVKFK